MLPILILPTLSVNGLISNKEIYMGNHTEYLGKLFNECYADGLWGGDRGLCLRLSGPCQHPADYWLLTTDYWPLSTVSRPSIWRTVGRTQGSRAKAGQAARKARKKKVA
jgi:hypothetical protein